LLGNSAPFLLTKVRGTGGAALSMQTTKAPGQDGSSLHEVTLEPRPIEIEGYVCGTNRDEMYQTRKSLASILNPKIGQGTLTYENDLGKYRINAIPEESPVWGDRSGNNEAFTITFIAYNPFWLENLVTMRQLSYIVGGLMYPLRLPTKFSDRTYKRVLTNSGDVETPVEIEFYGPATNPTVKNNTTNEFITIKRELSETDKLVINTEFGNKKVEIVAVDGTRTNVFNWIDLSSTFFQIQVGDNELEYNSNNESSLSKVIVKYSNRYVGV
jgi:phage-related protein